MENLPKNKLVWGAVILCFVVVPLLFVGIAQWSLAVMESTLPAWQADDLETDVNTYIFDAQGNKVAELYAEKNRRPVQRESISEHLIQAFLATEDKRFYQHGALDFKGIARAAMVNLNEGETVEGGSTITQQLVKNALLTPERTFQRKIKEALLAMQIEERFTKDEILLMYLNRIYFGHGAYGVETAANRYFGKRAKDLNLAEAAMLAGIPKNPAKYAPYYNLAAAKDRQAEVLSDMVACGYTSVTDAAQAKEYPLVFNDSKHAKSYSYPYFVDAVLEEVVDQCNVTEEELYRGGLRIYTTLDPKIQSITEQVMSNPKSYPSGPADQQVQGAVVVLDYQRGFIKAVVGGRRHQAKRGFNRATQLKRQPGSTFKPIAVYAPALEKKYPPDTVLEDAPVTFGKYSPKNADGRYHGYLKMRDALRLSINVYAVKLLDLIGVENGFNFAKKLGFELDRGDRGLALALGGLTKGVSPKEMAAAYGAFANNGVYVKPTTIVSITDFRNRLIYQYKPGGKRAMTQQTAYLMTELLQGVVRAGTGTRARLNRPVAGKTGTTQLPDSAEFARLRGNKDAWFVGYTPELVAAVWLGYDHTDRNHYLKGVYGGSYPAQIWRKIMQETLANQPVKPFNKYHGKMKFRKDVDISLPVVPPPVNQRVYGTSLPGINTLVEPPNNTMGSPETPLAPSNENNGSPDVSETGSNNDINDSVETDEGGVDTSTVAQ